MLLDRSPPLNSGKFYPPEIKNRGMIKYDELFHRIRHICVFMACVCVCMRARGDFACVVHVLSCSQTLTQAWWRFNPVPLYMYTWLVVVVFSAEDIPPSSLYWSGPGHWGAKAKEKETRFCISILWKPYCLQNKLIAPVYLCLAPLLWEKGRAVICLIVWHIVTLRDI